LWDGVFLALSRDDWLRLALCAHLTSVEGAATSDEHAIGSSQGFLARPLAEGEESLMCVPLRSHPGQSGGSYLPSSVDETSFPRSCNSVGRPSTTQ
jgi:hypothetical protein